MTAAELSALRTEIRNDVMKQLRDEVRGLLAGQLPGVVTLQPRLDETTRLPAEQGIYFGDATARPLGEPTGPVGFVFDPGKPEPAVTLRRTPDTTARQVVVTMDPINEPIYLNGEPPLIVSSMTVIPNLNAEYLGGMQAEELISQAIRPQSTCFSFTNPRSVIASVSTSYTTLDDWVLAGTDTLGTVTATLLVIRYNAIASAGTFSLLVRNVTDALDISELTGLAAGTNIVSSGGPLGTWPTGSTNDIEIQIKHSTGASGNSFQLKSLHLIAIV